MQNKNKKEDALEKVERNLSIFGLFAFIIIGVIFFTYLLPAVYNLTDAMKNQKDGGAKGNLIVQNTIKEKNVFSGAELLKKENYSEALIYFQEAVDKDPNNVNLLSELAITHYRLKNYDKAIETFNRIINIEKNNSSAYNSIGNIYAIKGDTVKAEEHFRKAIEINPSSIQSYNSLALLLDEKGNKSEAIKVLNKGIETNSDNSELKVLLRIIEK